MMIDTPNAIDVKVGRNIKKIRIEKSITSAYVAGKLGVQTTDYQRMEAGHLRIGASHLQQLCMLLKIAPAAVYEGASATD